jgi:hypothetical protein
LTLPKIVLLQSGYGIYVDQKEEWFPFPQKPDVGLSMPQPGTGVPQGGMQNRHHGLWPPGRGMLDPTSGDILRFAKEGGHTTNSLVVEEKARQIHNRAPKEYTRNARQRENK